MRSAYLSFVSWGTFLLLGLFLGGLTACKQVQGLVDGLWDGTDDLRSAAGKIPVPSSLLERTPAVTTSLANAVTEVPYLDAFDPAELASMERLPRGSRGGWILDRPGLFEFRCRSYCLKAGTYAPGRGDGYLYAPLEGPRADVIRKILRKSVEHSEISQRDIQTLIWAIIARTRLADMPTERQATALRLLSAAELFEINDGALGLVPDYVLREAMSRMPPPVREVMEAEARIRTLLSRAGSTYEELERIAVRTGVPPRGEGSRDVPFGRWSYHPDGYFIRYLPRGYTRMTLQIHVPEPFTIERNAKGRICTLRDRWGSRVEIEYEDLRLPGPADSGGKEAHEIRSLSLVRHRALGPELVRQQAWNVSMEGLPPPSGNDSPVPEHWWSSSTRNHLVEVEKLLERLGGDALSARTDLTDLTHIAVEVRMRLRQELQSGEPWLRDLAHLLDRAWQHAFCRCVGSDRTFAWSRGAGTGSLPDLLTGLLVASDGPCDGSPDGSGEGPEFDPSDGAAMPGNTNKQRLAPSGAPAEAGEPHPDCGKVADLKSEFETIRDAFKNNLPKSGEDGFEYAARVQGMFGWGKPGGATDPMRTHLGCGIDVNEAYYQGKPDVFRAADCAHEKVHQKSCRHARTHGSGYHAWMGNANNYRQDELDAYQAGIDTVESWMAANGCE